LSLCAGVAELTPLYRSRAVSPVDVCRFYLHRIASRDSTIGAVTFLDIEAGQAAEASASRWRAGAALSPIDGVPMLVKANIAVRGWPWHAGIAAYRNRVAQADAACVARLRQAGVVILGLANMHEAAFGATNDNAAFGRACNPWDVVRTPGGSSGGSAAAVAAGFCAAALGTDTLGSVRIPSAYCGIVGVKPEKGLVDGTGLVPLCPQLDEVGVHARSVADAAAVLGVLSDLGGGSAVRPARVMKLAWESGVAVEPAQSAAVFRMVAQARSAGVTVQELILPDLDFQAVQRAAVLIVECGALAEHGAAIEANPDGFSADLRAMLGWAARQPQARIEGAQQRLAAVALMLRDVCADGTLIVAPTVPQQAFAWNMPVPDNQAAFTMLANIAGLAAISVPAGLKHGLPLAVQLVGRDVFGLFRMADRFAAPCGWPMIGKAIDEATGRT
jgi:aspartyl-tRNA(Asn)/glutamyl-tRNA(Gln) amidotransferase subunit A